MSNKFLSTTSAFLLSTSMLVADVPKVTVDIAPVHSLVSSVMEGVGKPDLIMPAGASPHEYQLKPSNAKSLEDADVVFWIGEDLTPWLEKGLESLAKDASITSLLGVDGIELLSFREGALFEAHDHGEVLLRQDRNARCSCVLILHKDGMSMAGGGDGEEREGDGEGEGEGVGEEKRRITRRWRSS